MSSKALLLLVIVLLAVSEVSSRGRGGGGGGGRGGGRGRASASRGSRTSLSSYSKRNAGYGTFRTARREAPRTSLLSRSHGGTYAGRRGSSYNGFGLGLGAGLLIGYGRGAIARPIGYRNTGFGYNYIHKDRDYNMEKPYNCTHVNVSEYFTTMKELQEINIDEEEMTCSSDDEVCYGRLSIIAANFTAAGDAANVTRGFEFSVEKGCATRDELAARSADSDFSEDRKCWTSGVTSRQLRFGAGDDDVPRDLLVALGLDGAADGDYTVDYKSQTETCLCDGWFCNGSNRLNARPAWLAFLSSVIFAAFLENTHFEL